MLPGQWREWDRDSFLGLLSTLGYYRITQDSVPNGQTYWANVTSGPVRASIASRQDLRASAQELVGILARQYYPAHSRRSSSSRSGPSTARRRTWSATGPSSTRTRPRATRRSPRRWRSSSSTPARTLPSALYISLPDTVRSLWPAVDGLLSSVRIVR